MLTTEPQLAGGRGRGNSPLALIPEPRFSAGAEHAKAVLAVRGAGTPSPAFLRRTQALALGEVSFHSVFWASGASVWQGYLGELWTSPELGGA